jgi:hypothetical protein
MKLFHKAKDGGIDSNVTGYWLIEWKPVFSIALLCFDKGSREAFHSHAFHAVSWILYGKLAEVTLVDGKQEYGYMEPSWKPVFTSRERTHQVHGIANKTWALTFRGPWLDKWIEVFPKHNTTHTLTHGRNIVRTTVTDSNNSVNTTIINVND